MFRKLYLSPLGFIISLVLNLLSLIHKPFIVYGYYNSNTKKFKKRTRISSTTVLVNKNRINIADNVWIGHYCLIDGIGGVKIGEGVQIASHSCIYTHSSQNAIRIMGKSYIEIPNEKRVGYIIDKVDIGDFTFIGSSSIILAGTKIGKACIIGAGSIVKGDFPDYSIIAGNPAKIIGDTKSVDSKIFEKSMEKRYYYNPEI